MKSLKSRGLFQTVLLLLLLTLLSGCGSGGSTAGTGTGAGTTTNSGPSVSLVTSNGSTFVVKATNFSGVAGMDITINYNSSTYSTYSSPTVTQGSFISGAIMAANKDIPGTIRIAVISTTTFSGSGEIATVSFRTSADAGVLPTISAKLFDINGAEIP